MISGGARRGLRDVTPSTSDAQMPAASTRSRTSSAAGAGGATSWISKSNELGVHQRTHGVQHNERSIVLLYRS